VIAWSAHGNVRQYDIIYLGWRVARKDTQKGMSARSLGNQYNQRIPRRQSPGRARQINVHCPVATATLTFAYAYGVSDEQRMESPRAELFFPRAVQSAGCWGRIVGRTNRNPRTMTRWEADQRANSTVVVLQKLRPVHRHHHQAIRSYVYTY
jgi:hypothetical protein